MTTHQINLEFYWPEKVTRSSKLEKQVYDHFAKNPHYSNADKIEYVLKKLADRDFCILTFGDDRWHYLQFAREGSNLVLNFPYSIKLGNRYLQIDRVTHVLQRHGFKSTPSFWANFIGDEKYMYYEDTLEDKIVYLDAYFGIHHEKFATKVTLEIATQIFRFNPSQQLTITVGSWKV